MPHDPPELLSTIQLANRLSLRPDTICRWTRRGVIPCICLSPKVVRYIYADVVAALRQRSTGGAQ